MAFDIAVQKQEHAVEDEGLTFPVLDVNDDPAFDDDGTTPVTWTVCGLNSETYAKAEAWQAKELRALRGREPTAQEKRKMYAGFLARCSRGFSGFTQNGQRISFSTDIATEAIMALPHLRRQIEARIGDRQGFIKKPSIS